mmetsp:Transcript_528/g.2032  ORF Transcript_528/g.2032 Transcript_528/m.2032 type:complete len:224 (+) Transcript_528:90-761(+)
MGINLGRKYLSPANAEASYVSTFAARASRVGVGAYGLDPPHFLYGLSRMSSALPWNGSRNTGIAAVLFPTRITSRDVTSTTELASMSVALFFVTSTPPRRRSAYRWYLVLFFGISLCATRSQSSSRSRNKSMRSLGAPYVTHTYVPPGRSARQDSRNMRDAREEALFFVFASSSPPFARDARLVSSSSSSSSSSWHMVSSVALSSTQSNELSANVMRVTSMTR